MVDSSREKIEFESNEEIRVVDSVEGQEDKHFESTLRPSKFEDFTGQNDVKSNLSIAIHAAKQRSEPLEHVLLSGPPGLGKTTLAHIISHEMGANIRATSGPAIERAGDLVGILTSLDEGDVLFIDEIHRMSKVVEEFLYPAMENYNIDFIVDKGPYAKTVKFTLKPFTLIGATTRSGLLSAPLRDRFGILAHLDFYETTDLDKIVRRSASLLNFIVSEECAHETAKRSRGTPRIANRLLRRVRDYSQVKTNGKLDLSTCQLALKSQGVDAAGLDEMDRKVLRSLIEIYDGGPVGIDSIAATLNEETDTIVDVIEPYLLKAGFLKRTARGRAVTKKTYEHLQKSPSGRNRTDLF